MFRVETNDFNGHPTSTVDSSSLTSLFFNHSYMVLLHICMEYEQEIQSTPKVLENQGQIIRFCCEDICV